MKTEQDKEQRTRMERAKEELERAKAFAMVPGSAIPLGRNFRVEGLARLGNGPDPRDRMRTSMEKASGLAPRSQLGVPLDDPKMLEASLESLLRKIDPANRAHLAGVVMERFGDLAAQSDDVDRIEALRDKVFAAVIGEQSADRTRGGSAKDAAPAKAR